MSATAGAARCRAHRPAAHSVRAVALGALAGAALGLGAPAPVSATLLADLGVQQLGLREQDDDGRTLVRESGALPRLALQWQPAGADARWAPVLSAAWSAGTVGYDGRTQTGTPLRSRTLVQTVALGAALRHRGPASPWWGEVGLGVESFRRRIRGADGAAGLDEHLLQPRLQLGVGIDGAGWQAWAGWDVGLRAPLKVQVDGEVLPGTTLRSGRSQGMALGAALALAEGWSLAAQGETLRVDRSLPREVGGVATIQQPRWQRTLLGVSLQRRWSGF